MLADPMSGELPEFRGAPYQIIATSRQTLASKPDVLKKGLRALAKAQKLIKDNPSEAKRAARSWFKELSDAQYEAEFNFHVGGTPTAVTISETQFKRTVDLMNLTEKEKFTLSFADAVTSDLAKAVDGEIPRK